MTRYQIKDWDQNFESAKSRQRDKCSYVCLPNKMGMSLTMLLSADRGISAFGIFILLVESCSRQRRPREGYLTDTGRADGAPWTIRRMSVLFHRPEDEISDALKLLSSEDVGWIDVTEQVSAECPPSVRQLSL